MWLSDLGIFSYLFGSRSDPFSVDKSLEIFPFPATSFPLFFLQKKEMSHFIFYSYYRAYILFSFIKKKW